MLGGRKSSSRAGVPIELSPAQVLSQLQVLGCGRLQPLMAAPPPVLGKQAVSFGREGGREGWRGAG